MQFRHWILGCLMAILGGEQTGLFGQAQIQPQGDFFPADVRRTYMDRGGAWDGSTEVTATTGDTFTLTLTNTASSADIVNNTAYNIALSATLPTGFQYVANSATGIPGITASQAGGNLTFTIPPTDIAPGDSVTVNIGLYADSTTPAGTSVVSYAMTWEGPGGSSGGSLGPIDKPVVVNPGASTLQFDPVAQTLPIGGIAEWDVTITNTGLGGLFDVVLDESLINPNPGGSLQLIDMVQVPTNGINATGSEPVFTMPYLFPGETFVMHVRATVTGCLDITNEAQTDDRVGDTAKSETANVTLDLTVPLIAVTPPDISLQYAVPTNLAVPVVNTGAGDANLLTLDTNIHTLGVSISNIAAGWSFDSGTGRFTYTANGGSLLNNTSATLSFDVQATDVCANQGGGTVFWNSHYFNACSDEYFTPVELSTINPPSDAPTVTLNVTGAPGILAVGENGSYSVVLDALNTQHIQTDPLIVNIPLPAGITVNNINVPAGTTSNCSGSCQGGDVLTWEIPLSQLPGPLQVDIDFTAPTDPCLGGTLLTYPADVVASSTAGCSLSTSGQDDTLLVNFPNSGVTLQYSVANAPDGCYETGNNDNGDLVWQIGEGEFIPFTVVYDFSNGYPGEWAGSTYEDDFGGLSDQIIIPNTVEINLDNTGFQAVPAGSITQSSGSLAIDMDFVAGLLGDTDVDGHSVEIRYQTTVPDSALLPGSQIGLTHLSTFTLASGNGAPGICNNTQEFIQGLFNQICRAEANIAVAMPQQIDICETFPVTFTISNGTVEFPSNIFVTIDTSGEYEYATGQTPVYGGDFNSGNIVYSENGGVNPTFELTPTSTELQTSGTITVQMRKKAGTAASPSPLVATVAYDDNETSLTSPRDFVSAGSDSPLIVREGLLTVSVSPQTVTVVSDSVSWVIYANNGGSGATFETVVRNTLPTGLTADIAATDAANPGFPVTVNGQVMEWSIGSIAPGFNQSLTVVANVDSGANCNLPPGSNGVEGEWGCNGVLHETDATNDPNFLFPTGELQVVHDTTNSYARLCEDGSLTIIVRNVGPIHLYDVEVTEVLEPLTSGVDFAAVPNFEYSTDMGGAWSPAGAPTGDGSSGNPYRWTATQVPPLAELELTTSSGVSEVWIRFNVAVDEPANAADPSILAAATSEAACGDIVPSPGTGFTAPIQKPDITMAVDGRNLTTGGGYAETVVASPTDTVEWRIRITNSGDVLARNVRLENTFTSNGSTGGTIFGPGLPGGGQFIVDGEIITIDDIGVGATNTYTITENLGGSCQDDQHQSSVSWGCDNNGASAASNLTSPSDNDDTSNLVLGPDYGGGITQTFTPLSGGRMEVVIQLTNTGSRSLSHVVTDTLPGGMILDQSFTPTLTSTGGITGYVPNYTTPGQPIFNLTGTLEDGESATLTFRIIQSGNFDTTSDPLINPENTGNGLDPNLPADGNNVVDIDFEDLCGSLLSVSIPASMSIPTPDVDIAMSPVNQVVRAGQTYNFDITLTNNGDANSIADQIELLNTIGSGWGSVQVEILTPGTGGTAGLCATTNCTPAEIGTLAQGQSAVIRITATAQDVGQSLEINSTVEASLFDDSGTDTGDNYSLDGGRSRVAGFDFDKSLISTSETFTTDPNIAVGEEATWLLRARWFGGESISNITLRDTLPANLGYVSHTTTGNHDLGTVTASGNTPVTSGTIDFTIADFSGDGTFEIELVTRSLNLGTASGTDMVNNFGAEFDALGFTFASNNPADGFGGDQAALHDDETLTLQAPDLFFDKQIRNVDTGSAFADSGTGDALDEIEYQVQVRNDGDAPLFDIVVNDALASAKLILVDGAADGVDNDGDGSTDEGSEGTFTAGAGGSLTFNEANTLMPGGAPVRTFAQLDPGQTLTLLYRATTSILSNPNEILNNNVDVVGSTLPGTNGNQTGTLGNPGDPHGEAIFDDTDVSSFTVENAFLAKSLLTTAVGADQSLDVRIGEQAVFQLQLEIPAGTVTNLRVDDLLPEGFLLLDTPIVQFGAAFTDQSQPSITPGTLPAFGSPLNVRWDFGTREVGQGVAAARTLTIEYLVQVRNITTNVDATQLINDAMVTFDGSTANMSPVTLTIRETTFTQQKTVDNAGPVDAGDVLTYTIRVENTGDQDAFDLNIVDTLSSHTTYVANSTTVLQGPALNEPDINSGVLTWGRLQAAPVDVDMSPSDVLEFTFQVTVNDSVEPGQDLQNDYIFDWTSLDGSPGPGLNGFQPGAEGAEDGERTGSGIGANQNNGTDNANTSVDNSVSITKAASGDTVNPSGFQVGDLVSYTLTIDVQEGTMDNFRLVDTLPDGMEFWDFQPLAPDSGTDGFTYVQPSGGNAPSQGATGTIQWSLGSLVNAGDALTNNDTLTLTYRVRIADDSANIPLSPLDGSLLNSALARYEDSTGADQDSGSSGDSIDYHQPQLILTKDLRSGQATEVGAGDSVMYVASVQNTGSAPAYNVVVRDTLPAGMRDATPVVITATLNGIGVTLDPLTYNSTTGEAVWTLNDTQPLEHGEFLVIEYDATVDGDVGGGLTLANTALVDAYYSQPASQPNGRRTYPSSTQDGENVTTPTPGDIAKSAAPEPVNIGDTVTFTITVPQTPVNVALFDVNILDSVDANLRVDNVTDNSASLGTNASDNSAGNAVDVIFDQVPANQQAVLNIEATVLNLPTTDQGDTFSNQASFTWADSPGGPASTPIQSNTTTTTVSEPDLVIDKTFKEFVLQDTNVGLQSGDTVTYTIAVTNQGDGAAWDFRIRDIIDENLVSPTVTPNPDNPGIAVNSGTSGGVTTWTWTVVGPLDPGNTFVFDVSFQVGLTVSPFQQLDNYAEVDWTSTQGGNPDERNSSGGHNDYTHTDPTVVTVTAGTMFFTKELVPANPTEFTIGDLVVYRLRMSTGQGTIQDVHFLDTLPTAVEFVSSSLTVTNYQVQGGGAVTVLSGPNAGDQGAVDFSFGTIESTGADPELVLDVTVRVLDDAANFDGEMRQNSAAVTVQSGGVQTIPALSDPVFDIVEPDLVLALDGPSTMVLTQPDHLQAHVHNGGTSTAYQPTIQLQLPDGMRDYDPTTQPITVSIAGGRTLTLTEGTDFVTTYDSGTGLLSVQLTSAQAYVDVAETLTIDFEAALDDDAPDNTPFQIVSTVTDYAGQDGSAGAPPQTRTYAATLGAGTTGTPNGTTGDDHTDDHTFNSQAPTLAVTKSVDLVSASPGQTLQYSVTITNSGSVDATGAEFSDTMAAEFLPGTLTNVVVTPSTGTLNVMPNGGANGTGYIGIVGMSISQGTSVVVTYEIDLQPVLPSGTEVFNQSILDVPGFMEPFVSDSTNAADDNGIEEGNSSGDPNDDDPTRTIIQSAPQLDITKDDEDLNGPSLEPGDILRYRLVITNNGNEHAVNAILQDAIPANTTYVAGSTTLNAQAIADVSGTTPLMAGMQVNSDGDPAGELRVGGIATVTFDVIVDSGLVNGTVITNQAFLEGEGEGSGAFPPIPSDDPETSGVDDPTQNVVGNAPVLDAQKLVIDDNGGFVEDGDTLTWVISIANEGNAIATNVRFTDLIPADTTYVAESMTYDPDGPSGALPPQSLTDALDGDAGDYSVTAGGAITVMLGDFAAGLEAEIRFQCNVNSVANGTVIQNQGVVSSNEQPDEPTDLDGDDANGDQPTPVIVGNQPALNLVKDLSDLNGGRIEEGDVLRYTLTVSNFGSADATNVVLTDDAPVPTLYIGNTTYVDGVLQTDIAGPSTPLSSGLNVGTISSGDSVTVTFQVLVPLGTPSGTAIDNTAGYSADGGISGDSNQNSVTLGGSNGSAVLSGFVWTDLNHDNTLDISEPLLQGWTVELLLNGNVTATSITDSNGYYEFLGLLPGPGYQVRFRHPTYGYVYGQPVSNYPGADTSNGIIDNLTLNSGSHVANQNLPVSPSGVVYDAITRDLVAGAEINILGPPGFDPNIHLLPGQQGQITGADGSYRLDFVNGYPAGEYRIEINPPGGYVPFPGGIIPPETNALDPTGGFNPYVVAPNNSAPQDTDPTTYYVLLDLTFGDPEVVNNHLALEPILGGAIVVRKTTPMVNVSRGDLVPYTITAENTLSSVLTPIELRDKIPPGFKYVRGTATVDGRKRNPQQQGRLLTWPNLTFQPGETKEIQMVLVVGAGVSDGEYINRAWAHNSAAAARVSNIAQATVRLIPDPVFDCAEIIGKVFDDRNANGYQDDGEPGLPGIRVATATGLLITTDSHGRYHITCADVPNEQIGSNFILKLDERTLPTGYRVTTENPRVVRLTRGKITKLNFGVSIHRVVRLDVTREIFKPGTTELLPGVAEQLRVLIEKLEVAPSLLRLSYLSDDQEVVSHENLPEEDRQEHLQERRWDLAQARLDDLGERVEELWEEDDERHPLVIETEFTVVRSLQEPQAVPPTSLDDLSWAVSQNGLPDNVDDPRDLLGPALNPQSLRLPPRHLQQEIDSGLREDDEPQGGWRGKVEDDGSVQMRRQPSAAERHSLDGQPIQDQPVALRITVDGELVEQGLLLPGDRLRDTDLHLAASDIRIRYDRLDQNQVLNVTAWPDSAVLGETLWFNGYTNYAHWIDRAEVRVFLREQSENTDPYLILPLDEILETVWVPQQDTPLDLKYVLRVYATDGRYDETTPQHLSLMHEQDRKETPDLAHREKRIGYGENRLGVRNIEVHGGAVVVDGGHLLPGQTATLMGQPVPVDPDGKFVARQLLPPGRHEVVVEIHQPEGGGLQFKRPIYIPSSDWFFVAMGDITIGQNSVSGPAKLVTSQGEFDEEVYARGRGMMYLKGKIKGEYLITAMLDTREEDLDSLFSNLNDKDPRQLLRRLDTDRFYPVYGDDSTLVEDAPTQGKFYVRIERGESHALWGNFTTQVLDTELLQVDRGLYGAKLHWVSEDLTSFGERRTQVDAFGAEPDTLYARQDFRGTGGSLYYLRHTDIVLGSERLRVEVRDKVSGVVLHVNRLVPYQDYTIDPLQGRILLTHPLPSTADDSELVRAGELSGNPVFLVARYEYTPGFQALDNMAVGGRASHWFNDHIKAGVTASRQEQTGGDQDLYGVDVTVRHDTGTFVKAEFAHSSGPGLNENATSDGGFFFGQLAPIAGDRDANAYLVEAAFDLEEVESLSGIGTGSFYFRKRDRGFSAPGQPTPLETRQIGGALDLALDSDEDWRLQLNYDEKKETAGQHSRGAELGVKHRFDSHWEGALAVRQDLYRTGPRSFYVPYGEQGDRTDLAGQLGFRSSEDWDLYGFLQGTLARDQTRRENNRAGIGGNYRLNDRLSLGGELSEGNGGLGANVAVDYQVNQRTNTYLNFQADPDRTDHGYRGRNSSVTSGSRNRFSDTLSIYNESQYRFSDFQSGLIHAFGADYAPSDLWTFGATFESGKLKDNFSGEFDRLAAGVTAGFRTREMSLGSALEFREDESVGQSRTTWLMRNSFGYQVHVDWRMFAKFDFSRSHSSFGDFFDGNFTEGSLGFAHRPVDFDAWNTLFRYTYLANLPSPGQVSPATNAFLNYQQRSHVLSVDTIYDLTKWLSVGGKYGLRIGELRMGRLDVGPWISSTAHLGILRADLHVVSEWDVLLESRWLRVNLANDRRHGYLLAVFRHLGDNVKIGIGYNFSDFSDDLTDLSYDHQGWFINFVSKF